MKQNILFFATATLALLAGVWLYQSNQASQRDNFYDVSGIAYNVDQLAQETFIVNYFAEWCAPCLREVPELNKFQVWVEKQPNVTFVAVSYDELNEEKVIALTRQYDMQFPVIAHTNSRFPIAKPHMLPATFILHHGEQVEGLFGEVKATQLIQLVENL